ncbi:MAG: hypothetical protein M1304_01725, partial [Candidatus Thermoplasmatota archaeon]|nr:hypothetical protein [Candidatus Thermoplasmatota archaeon]
YARKTGEFKLLQHLVFPMVAIGVLAAVIFFSLYPAPPPYPYNLAAYVGIGWIPVSGILTFVEWKLHPGVVRNAGQHNINVPPAVMQEESK